MNRLAAPGTGRLHQLRLSIEVLGAMEEPKEVSGLLEACIAELTRQPTRMVAVKREPRDTYNEPEERRDDVNHSIAWLTRALGAGSADQMGPGLIKAREVRQAGRRGRSCSWLWMLRGSRQRIDLKKGFDHMKDRKPLVSESGLRAMGQVVAFSRDGKLMAAGSYVMVHLGLDTGGGIRYAGQSCPVRFFPMMGKILYLAGGGGGLQIQAGYDWRTGKVVQPFAAHKAGIHWTATSNDGRIMATAGLYEGTLCVSEVATGKLLRKYSMPGRWC